MKQKVIVFDYQELTSKGIAQFVIQNQDFELVLQALSSEEVEEFLSQHVVDLLVLDINNPAIKPTDYITKLLSISENLKILGMGAKLSENTMKEFLKAGGHGLILKDTNANELIKGMHDVLTYSAYFSSGISYNWIQNIKKTSGQDLTFSSFKPREIEIMKLICQEKTSREIGEELFLSKRTVENHITNIKQKLNCKNMVGIARFIFDNEFNGQRALRN